MRTGISVYRLQVLVVVRRKVSVAVCGSPGARTPRRSHHRDLIELPQEPRRVVLSPTTAARTQLAGSGTASAYPTAARSSEHTTIEYAGLSALQRAERRDNRCPVSLDLPAIPIFLTSSGTAGVSQLSWRYLSDLRRGFVADGSKGSKRQLLAFAVHSRPTRGNPHASVVCARRHKILEKCMKSRPLPAAVQDYDRMMAMLTGFWVTQIVRAAAIFNLADHLVAGTDTPEAIAAAESTDLDATRRLVRTCASLGLVTSADGVHFTATSLLNTLLKDDPNSLRGMVLAQAAPGHWLTWGRFPDAVRSGDRQIKAAHGTAETIFDYLAAHLDEASYFTEAMSNLSAAAAIEIAKVIDTQGVSYALDIGGANGEVLRAMLRANPDLRGGVFDLPHVVPDAVEAARKDGLQERFTAFGGDFFESVPCADLYVLKYVLHDWDDESCVRILRNCRGSLQEGGRIIAVDHLVGELGIPGLAPMMDMNMLVMAGGRERDIAEFDALFEAAGLRRTAVGQGGPFAVIETVAI